MGNKATQPAKSANAVDWRHTVPIQEEQITPQIATANKTIPKLAAAFPNTDVSDCVGTACQSNTPLCTNSAEKRGSDVLPETQKELTAANSPAASHFSDLHAPPATSENEAVLQKLDNNQNTFNFAEDMITQPSNKLQQYVLPPIYTEILESNDSDKNIDEDFTILNNFQSPRSEPMTVGESQHSAAEDILCQTHSSDSVNSTQLQQRNSTNTSQSCRNELTRDSKLWYTHPMSIDQSQSKNLEAHAMNVPMSGIKADKMEEELHRPIGEDK